MIRVLKELTEYDNKIEKNQEEIKVTLSEIKKNLQGNISEGMEARIQIKDLEHKEEINIQSEQKEETRIQNKNKKKKEEEEGGEETRLETFGIIPNVPIPKS